MKSSPVASFVAIFSGPATLYFRDGDESGISAPMQSNGTAFGRAFVSDMLANVVELAATMDESWAAVCAAAVVCALAVGLRSRPSSPPPPRPGRQSSRRV
jgi:hypothetical protein